MDLKNGDTLHLENMVIMDELGNPIGIVGTDAFIKRFEGLIENVRHEVIYIMGPDGIYIDFK